MAARAFAGNDGFRGVRNRKPLSLVRRVRDHLSVKMKNAVGPQLSVYSTPGLFWVKWGGVSKSNDSGAALRVARLSVTNWQFGWKVIVIT